MSVMPFRSITARSSPRPRASPAQQPSRTGDNGYRYYDRTALVRLQRILLLQEPGLGLPAVAEFLGQESDAEKALGRHLEWLRQEQDRLARQIAAVQQTMAALKEGTGIMAEKMFDGFDHTRYQQEVEERWGKDAYAAGDAWWRGMGAAEKDAWKRRSEKLCSDWLAAAAAGVAPDSGEAQELARRHVEWLTGIPGTPAAAPATGSDIKGYVTGLGEMYVADLRFAANYGGEAGAAFVRDALRIYAEKHL